MVPHLILIKFPHKLGLFDEIFGCMARVGTLRWSTATTTRRRNHKVIHRPMEEYLVGFNLSGQFSKKSYYSTLPMKHFTKLFQQSSMVESYHTARLSDKPFTVNKTWRLQLQEVLNFTLIFFSELSLALNKEGL